MARAESAQAGQVRKRVAEHSASLPRVRKAIDSDAAQLRQARQHMRERCGVLARHAKRALAGRKLQERQRGQRYDGRRDSCILHTAREVVL